MIDFSIVKANTKSIAKIAHIKTFKNGVLEKIRKGLNRHIKVLEKDLT